MTLNYPSHEISEQAFDVMVNRGWYSVPHVRYENRIKSWIALNTFAVEIDRGGNTGTYFESEDPFTCLVEADCWYKKYMENNQ